MSTALHLDLAAIRRACQRYGVARLRIFGSATTERFDPQTSDIDFLVDFAPDNPNMFHDYFDLKFELEEITGRPADLVDASTAQPLLQSLRNFNSPGPVCSLNPEPQHSSGMH